jgi:hypothetical protein
VFKHHLEGSGAVITLVIEAALDDSGPIRMGDVKSAVAAIRVENHDVVGPLYRLEAGGEVDFLIKSDN